MENNQEVLLDSTPGTTSLKYPLGHPKSTPSGVLKSWHALRVSYCRELKLKEKLDSLGIENFIPMCWDKETGKDRKLVPAIHNLVFARATKQELDAYMETEGEKQMTHYFWDKTHGCVMTISDKEMDDFIRISRSNEEDIIYLSKVDEKLRSGARVRVTGGPFAGVEGKIVRIRKSRRILVEIPGFLAVASAYVRPEFLELIETEEN
jgi:transcription antitermination factor NusG